jgi:hypothetical protein
LQLVAQETGPGGRWFGVHGRRRQIGGCITLRFQLFFCALLLPAAAAVAQPAANGSASAASPTLDFEFFKARIEPIFTT